MKKSEEKKLIAQVKKNLLDYNETPVVTTAQLAAYYECEPRQIKQNFNNNVAHFEEGKHYFKVEGESLNKLRVENFDLQISMMTRTLYLWTRRGAMRHAKMLNNEKAWEVFDFLEDFYFDHEKFEWHKARRDYKIAILKMTDTIRDKLIPLAIKQGMEPEKAQFFYNNYNRLLNKYLGIKSDSRELLSQRQLFEMEKMSALAAARIEKCVSEEIEYHAIYYDVKAYFAEYARISMF